MKILLETLEREPRHKKTEDGDDAPNVGDGI